MHLSQFNPTQEANHIINFIQGNFQNAHVSIAIIAVSGGVDSATSLVLTTQALSPQNTLVLHLPSKTTQPIHTRHVQELIHQFQIPEKNFITINIGGLIQKTWRTIKHYTQPITVQASSLHEGKKVPYSTSTQKPPNRRQATQSLTQLNRLRLANIAARLRMTLLYDQAKKHGALVIGTENLSEYLLGYYTRYGDEASDLEPIRHLYKTQVIQLAKHLNIPQPIIEKPPSADLWPGQTDANELGFTYSEADPILHQIKQGKSHQQLIKDGNNKDLINQIISLINQNHFKNLVPYTISQ